MKKLISALAALAVLGLSNALAADSGTTLDKIEKACSAITSTQSHFDHNRTIKASGNTVKMEGILYYTAPGKLAMYYTNPPQDLMIINGDRFYVKRGQANPNTFDTSKNPTMAGLKNSLLWCIQGKVREVAKANNADIAIMADNTSYIVTVTARVKPARGYSKIRVTYRKSDCLPVAMTMEDVSGIVNVYRMSDIITKPADEIVYRIPER
ncbi:MAG: outer membrane lipoprotein carrier protein LolA [Bacteroidales bacterium]|nr:outer membrane lipoprotein carrier protein LolA [Bacteroidales bacterium]